MEWLDGQSMVTATYIIAITATVANAIADHLMFLMGFDTGSIWNALGWSPLQWYWHVCKWVFFNGSLGALIYMQLGLKRTAILGGICFLIWELTTYLVR